MGALPLPDHRRAFLVLFSFLTYSATYGGIPAAPFLIRGSVLRFLHFLPYLKPPICPWTPVPAFRALLIPPAERQFAAPPDILSRTSGTGPTNV